MKKQCISLCLLATFSFTHSASGDTTALQPNLTKEEKWERYEKNRLRKKSFFERIAEYFHEDFEEFKHGFLMDILFFKNNRVETPFAQEVLEAFDRSLDDVTILNKPLYGTPALTIFNTIVIDHDKMAKLTKEEQAFILGHELTHLKNRDWLTMPIASIIGSLCNWFGIGSLLKMYGLNEEARIAPQIVLYFLAEIYIKLPLIMKLSRHYEKRADLTAAETLNLAKAGATAFEKMRKKWICRQEVPLNPNGILHYLRTLGGILNSHPDLLERIAYLEELAEEQALSA